MTSIDKEEGQNKSHPRRDQDEDRAWRIWKVDNRSRERNAGQREKEVWGFSLGTSPQSVGTPRGWSEAVLAEPLGL